MKKKILHVVLTRFNLEIPDSMNTFKKDLWLDENYLEDRFFLFEKYCLPNMINQTNKNFVWMVFFHPDTPKKFMDKIEVYKRSCKNFKPIFVKNLNAFGLENINDFKNDSEWLVVSRLDNDDTLSKNFVEKIQESFVPEHDVFLDFVYGYNFNIKNNKLRKWFYKRNPFSSYIQKMDLADKIFYGHHRKIHKIGKVKKIRTNPIWCQNIHENNLLNRMRGRRVFSKKHFNEFFGKK